MGLGGPSKAAADQDGELTPAGPPSTKVTCITADTDGQRLRMEGEFQKARRRLEACAVPSCPRMVRDDCAERLAELDKHVAYVTFVATNGDGHTLDAIEVFVDDELVARRLDGQPLVVDAGEHSFRFSTLGRTAADVTLNLKERSRTSHAVVLRTKVETRDPEPEVPEGASSASQTWTEASTAPRLVEPSAVVPAPPLSGRLTARKTSYSATFIDIDTGNGRIEAAALGVGAVGIGLGVTFGLLTLSTWHSAQHDCQEPCAAGPQADMAQREVSDAKVDGTISTLAFVGGGAALLGGALLWWTDRAAAGDAQSLRLVPGLGLGRAQLTLRSRF
jgi:hypothetical protein